MTKPIRLVGLPVDGRPAVREQVALAVSAAGAELVLPAITALGDFRKPADQDTLSAWLMQEAAKADGLLLSLDMLLYGGLVPSRFNPEPNNVLLARLDILAAIKARHPDTPIYAFAATMRISNNNIADEEKLYWADYGALIWQWSFYQDRAAIIGDASDVAAAHAARAKIPQEVQADYLATRAKNFALTMAALDLVEKKIIDRLILPQDDTAQFGFNIAERRALTGVVQARGLHESVLIYPGADEVMYTLASTLLTCSLRARSTTKQLTFYAHYSDPLNVGGLTARYEDRPITESITAQIHAAGALLVTNAAAADVILAVHTSGTSQGDFAMQVPLSASPIVPTSWLHDLATFHAAKKPIALLDLAYANGGDPALITALASAVPLAALAAYAGWNTASNSAGSLAAQCVLARDDFASAANRAMLCLRLYEDYFYQAHARQLIRDQIIEPALTPAALEHTVAESFIETANTWGSAQGLAFRVARVYLPWQRTFEIGITLAPAEAAYATH